MRELFSSAIKQVGYGNQPIARPSVKTYLRVTKGLTSIADNTNDLGPLPIYMFIGIGLTIRSFILIIISLKAESVQL